MEKSLDERITQNLKYEIETCGKKKKDIADAMGVTPGTISQYLSGSTQPTLANLSRLCSFIGCSADEILCIEETDEKQ